MALKQIENLRNIAIIAHVDHGKTTLVDALLNTAHVFRNNQSVVECVMDSDDIERERGITIFSKNAAIRHAGIKINIIDTPGHADFGGEVERVLRMADGVLLLVDSFEGPMPQTRFVLRKALEANLRPLVVINKIDRSEARPEQVVDEVLELFIDLEANDEQLEFPVIYASGRSGYARLKPDDDNNDCLPLIEAIIEKLPPPLVDPDLPLQIQVASVEYNEFVGRIAVGRILRGTINEKQTITLLSRDGKKSNQRVEALEVFSGLGVEKVTSASAGEIVRITGIPEVGIYDTITDVNCPESIPAPHIDEPTLTMEFRATDSPFMGKDGKYVTSRHLKERLERELRSNVALRVDFQGEGSFMVAGRGVLHLGILIENMRREGYEFSVGRPNVIIKEIDGQKSEPVELLTIDVPNIYQGKVMEIMGERRANLDAMEGRGDRLHIKFTIPSRGLIGLRTKLLNNTRGEAVINHIFLHYEPWRGEVPARSNGVMISVDSGMATAYAIDSLQLRGTFFIEPQTQVYPGMIVGEHARPDDLGVNVCRGKKLTNVRAAGSDRNLDIAPPRRYSLEAALEYIEDDELIEVTPLSIRMRKRILDENERKKQERLKN